MAGRPTDYRVVAAIARAHKAGLQTISPRALELLCRLAERQSRKLPGPTYDEMRDMMGVEPSSNAIASRWLAELKAAGCIEWEKHKWGTLRVLVRIEPVRHDDAPAAGNLARG